MTRQPGVLPCRECRTRFVTRSMGRPTRPNPSTSLIRSNKATT